MAIAGAVVVPARRELERDVGERLNSLQEVNVHGIGKTGIAVVLEAGDIRRLKEVSEEIREWEDVIDVLLAYLNWEEVRDSDQRRGCLST